MRTRSKPAAKASSTESAPIEPTKTLCERDPNPPRLFILPKDASSNARIVTLANPASGIECRYFHCPEKGFYEFTKISAAKRTTRSWLLEPEKQKTQTVEKPASINPTGKDASSSENGSTNDPEESSISGGYVVEEANLFVATPLDPVFLLLPALSTSKEGQKKLFLSIEDYLDKISEASPHLGQLLRHGPTQKRMEARIECVCDNVEAGDMKMYRLSMDKLVKELAEKAQRMVERGLPSSMETKFVQNALEAPIMSIKREESGVSIGATESQQSQATEGSVGDSITDPSTSTSAGTDSQNSVTTEATSVHSSQSANKEESSVSISSTPGGIQHLLRLQTALDFMIYSYLPTSLRKDVRKALKEGNHIGFEPLNVHLEHLASLRSQAQALRSLSDNISRKRSTQDDDDESAQAEKKQKLEEEKKKNQQSRGVRELSKVNTSGMKKLSAFFTKTPAKK